MSVPSSKAVVVAVTVAILVAVTAIALAPKSWHFTVACSSAPLRKPCGMAMAEWTHGERGYRLRLWSGTADIVLQGTMPCGGIDIGFDEVADSVPVYTARKGDGKGWPRVYQRPVIVNIAITLDEGTVMCSYRCDSNGITTERGHDRAIGIGGGLIQLRTPSAAGLTATSGA